MSLCLQYVGEDVQDIQDKSVTCKRCLKVYAKIEGNEKES